jgi:L-cystine uptake protein TcyP (sodium:dicarboxylate symporter family)
MSISSEEKKFIHYWEQNRDKDKKLANQLLFGLPIGILFSVPVVLNYLLSKYWYKRADAVGSSQFNPIVLIVGVLLIAAFIGFFSRQLKWEQHEQRYLEFRARQEKEDEVIKNDLQNGENP